MADPMRKGQHDLEQARDEAPEARRLKSLLLANLSHDLRTPLNAILCYADMLQEGVYGPLEAQQQQVTQRILSNARRLLGMINSLLDQAHIEAGTLTLRHEAFAPSSLVAAIENVMRLAAEAKGLELRSEIAPDLPSCLVGDPGRIQQMLLNLVENAIRFTSQGGILLRLYLAEAGFWGIEVADTGPGIPPEAQGDIFEPFRPGEESPTPQHEGVGLGLAIVKQLALMMGGDVHLASEAGRGSRFTVRLPLATCKPTTAADALPAEFEPG